MKFKTIFKLIVVLAIIGGAAFYLYQKLKEKEEIVHSYVKLPLSK